MQNEMKLSHLWQTGKRALAVALLGLVLGLLAAPGTGLAAPQAASGVYHLTAPTDGGQGDSPIMP